MELKNYIDDGANWQACAVMAYLRYCADDIEYVAHNKDRDRNDCHIGITRYDNCREQGYIFFVRYLGGKGIKQRNYAVYQHRNSDCLCVVVNDVVTFNDPLSPEIWDTMGDKYDTTQTYSWGNILQCGEWIENDMKEFLQDNVTKTKQDTHSIKFKDYTLVPVWNTHDKIISYEIRKDGVTQGYISAEKYDSLKDDEEVYKACEEIANLPF